MALKEMNTTSKSIKVVLRTLGIDINKSTVQRGLRIAGLKYMKPLLKPLVSE